MNTLGRHRVAQGAVVTLVIAFATFAFMGTVSAALGATIIVDGSDTTSDAGGCGSKSNPCNTIQAGIDIAVAGDTVRVEKGTYAGGVVNKAVSLEAHGKVIINSGPYSHPGLLQAGFLFNPDRSGSGASIEGFDFQGTPQFAADDGKLDFAIFSRGADDVVVSHNKASNTLQAITSWNAVDWTIEHNDVTDLWTRCGGGIGILVGGFDGTTVVQGNRVAHNKVKGALLVAPTDCGGYDGSGVVLYADFRSQPGAPSVTSNTIDHNDISLVSSAPETVNANGVELTVAGTPPSAAMANIINGNTIQQNHARENSGNGIAVSTRSGGNTLDKNHFEDNGETDAEDQSTGTGTAGTANTWTGNKCDESDPAGLCK